MKHKEIIVISIKANNRDLPKNLKLGLKMKVVFFSSPFIKKKIRYFVLTLSSYLLEKYHPEEKLNSEEMLVDNLRNHCCKLNYYFFFYNLHNYVSKDKLNMIIYV